MESAQDTSSTETVTNHAVFLADVSRHLISLDIEPMLEAVGRAALGVLGDTCVVDRVRNATPTRILEVTDRADAWMEPTGELAGIARAELRWAGSRSRISVPIGADDDRFGTISFARNDGGIHSSADLALAQELADRLAVAIHNALEHLRLSDALEERERLIAIAAHELRGPLCSVRLGLQSFQRGCVALAPKATRMLEIMIKEERRVARMIDEMLDLGRIRSGQLQLDLASFDLCELVSEVYAQMQGQATAVGTKVGLELGGPVVGLWDRGRLHQVVTNLMGNALKYGEGRPVTVRVAADDANDVARLEVSDNGPGIPSNLHDRIFEPFKRADISGQQEGLGLGLFIVRSVVERLGGGVRVDSRPGAGATFVVELPVQVAH